MSEEITHESSTDAHEVEEIIHESTTSVEQLSRENSTSVVDSLNRESQ